MSLDDMRFAEQLLGKDELAQLYMRLLRQSVKDQYRGKRERTVLLGKIDASTGLVSSDIEILREDANGNFYTEVHHVRVKDDLGNMIHSIDEIAGQCIKGEIVKKGSLYSCLECGDNFCRRHIKLVDNNYKKPLCRYGPTGRKGCYRIHWKEHTDGGIAIIKKRTERLIAEKEWQDAKRALKEGQPQGILGTAKKLITGVESFECGFCKKIITLNGLYCPSCRNIISIEKGKPMKCPMCDMKIMEIDCEECGALNKL